MYSAFIPEVGLETFRRPILFPLYRVFRETDFSVYVSALHRARRTTLFAIHKDLSFSIASYF